MNDNEIIKREVAGLPLTKLRKNFIEGMSKSLITYTGLNYDPFETNCFPLITVSKPNELETGVYSTILTKPGVNKNGTHYDYEYLLNNLYLKHLFGNKYGRRILFDQKEIIFFKYLFHITHNRNRSDLRKICNINIDRCYNIVYTHIDKLKPIEKKRLLKAIGYKINTEAY